MRHAILIAAALCSFRSGALDDIPKEATPARGLCVVLPVENGDSLCRLAANGDCLAQGIALTDEALEKTRAAIQARGLNGLATAIKPASLERLPYADRLANLLIIDKDALGKAASVALDAMRVVAPGGSVFIKENGAWKKSVAAEDAGLDGWTHFDYDASGSGVSHDKRVRPPTAAQWRMELEPYTGLGGNPAGYRPYAGFRISGGRAFFGLKEGLESDGKREGAGQVSIVARDAFNGLPLWKIPQTSAGNGTPQEYQFAVNDTRVFTFLEPGTFPVGIDAATGKVATTFDKGAKSASKGKLHPGYYMLRATNSLLLQCAEEKLIAMDAQTGAIKWSHEEKDGFICFPRIIEKQKRVLAQVVEANAAKIQGRWANLKTAAVLCLDLETGKQIWRNGGADGQSIGQTIAAGDAVYAFKPAGIGASEESWKVPRGMVFKFDAADGTLRWKSEPFNWGYNLLVRDGKPYFATPGELNVLAPEDGKISAFWKAPFNNRCNRTSATDDWIIMGMGNYVDRDGVATVKGVSRGGCAQGVVPANGMTYFTPNTCHCITMLRGHLALSSEKILENLPDVKRLDKRGGFATPADAKPTALTGSISSEWLPQIWYGAPETVPVKDGARVIVAVIHEHRVVARENGKRVWSFTAGGRISQPPIINDGSCFFGSHDGWLYCLNAADGQLNWRFLAAPYERNFASHGQIESSWPVYNAVMHGGKVCCAAGLHPETGGGIHAWGLDPSTGAVSWHKQFKRSELLVKPGGKIAPNRVMNSPLQSDGKSLSITGLAFTPEEADADIQKRIDLDSLGDKNRNWGWSLRGPMLEKATK